MKAIAPGKLVLTGAYAVLDGAPAIVVAVDRHAVADASRTARSAAPEIRAALEGAPAPEVDVSALYDARGGKLGLGSSAAAVVAALAARALAEGADLADPSTRARIFERARAAHAAVQGGGSGVDVAASVYGGVLRYSICGRATVKPVALPAGVVLVAYFGGASARTSDLRARVDAARLRLPREWASLSAEMATAAAFSADAVEAGDAARFVASARGFAELLGALGRMAEAPIVSAEAAELAMAAAHEGAAFFPSGAGGGDVAVWLGTARPSAAFDRRAESLAHHPLSLGIDRDGVRSAS